MSAVRQPVAPDAQAPNEDAALLTRLAARDATAFTALYDRHVPWAFALAFRLLDDAGAAESAVEAAFLSLWHRASDIDPQRADIRTWLLTMIHWRATRLTNVVSS